MTAASNSEGRKRAQEAARSAETGLGATNGPGVGPGDLDAIRARAEAALSMAPEVTELLALSLPMEVYRVEKWSAALEAVIEVYRDDVRQLLAALDEARAEVATLRRGGEELGKSLVFWLDLAVKVTGSEDCIDDDGDGDYGAVAERLAEMPARATALEATLADVRALHTRDRERLAKMEELVERAESRVDIAHRLVTTDALRAALATTSEEGE